MELPQKTAIIAAILINVNYGICMSKPKSIIGESRMRFINSLQVQFLLLPLNYFASQFYVKKIVQKTMSVIFESSGTSQGRSGSSKCSRLQYRTRTGWVIFLMFTSIVMMFTNCFTETEWKLGIFLLTNLPGKNFTGKENCFYNLYLCNDCKLLLRHTTTLPFYDLLNVS